MPHLLTVAGSLRAGSSNAALLAAVAQVAPPDLTVAAYPALGSLPAFNPDREETAMRLPAAVRRWRETLAAADMVLVSTPEYAHGIPGVLKNALDWVVGGSELVGKPIGVINLSAASRFAFPQLIEVLTVMSANVVPEATVVLDLPRRGIDAAHLAANPVVAATLREVVTALVASLSTRTPGVTPGAEPLVRAYRAEESASLLDCIAELQDAERVIDGRLRPGRDIASDYLDAMLEECRRYAGQIFVIDVDGALAGFTTVYTRVPFERLDEPPGDYALVAELLVRREYRRRGFARALLAHGERYAASQGATELRIGVLRDNTAARALYLDSGFRPYIETLSKTPTA